MMQQQVQGNMLLRLSFHTCIESPARLSIHESGRLTSTDTNFAAAAAAPLQDQHHAQARG